MSAHVRASDGSLSSVSLCRTINVHTHPELRERALSGALHRLEDGRELAVPFVYHDPDNRKFALVIPEPLAHTELVEHARLLAAIAEDTEHPIPLYVKRLTAVIGRGAFVDYLEEPEELDEQEGGDTMLPDAGDLTLYSSGPASAAPEPPDEDVPERDDNATAANAVAFTERQRALIEQERSLVQMAEALSAREQALARELQRLQSTTRALDIREQALSAAANWASVSVANSSEPDPAYDEEISAVSGVRAGGAHPRTHPPPLPVSAHRHRSLPPPLPLRSTPAPPTAARELGARGSVLHAPPPLPHHLHSALSSIPVLGREPEVAPPAYFAAQRVGQMAVRLVSDELWMFAHVDEADAALLRHGLDLLLQYVPVEGYPVVLLSLVATSAGPTSAPLRISLDGHAGADQRVIEHLSRSFRARVALYVRKRYSETLTVAALREGVAQAISDGIAELPKERPAISATDAFLRVEHDPPPLTNEDLPFGPARREASTTASVQASVAQLAAWLVPEKLSEATLTYSVPRNVIDATVRRVLRAASAFGVALPDELLSRAIEQNVARDLPSLLRTQLQAFRQRVEQGSNDLGASATRKNWERLLAQADEHNVEVEEALRTLSLTEPGRHADAGRKFLDLTQAELLERLQVASDESQEEDDDASEDRAALVERVQDASDDSQEDSDAAEERAALVERVQDASDDSQEDSDAAEERAATVEGLLVARAESQEEDKAAEDRAAAVEELCLRGETATLPALVAALPTLGRERLPRAMAHVLLLGETAGDALVGLLTADDPSVRQLASLALGRLHLKRAIAPLIELLERDLDGIHGEVARALGDFGAVAVQPLSEAAVRTAQPDRLTAALAHVANHGGAQAVERLENDSKPEVSRMARKAMSARARMEWEDLAVRQQRTLEEAEAATLLSQAFYAAVPKVAI